MFRRAVLQQFLHSFIQIFLVFLLAGTRVDRFGGIAGPNQLFGGWVIHVEDKSPDVDGGTGGSGHPAPTEPAAHTISVPLFLPINGDLIADIQINFVAISLGQAFDTNWESTATLISASTIWLG